MTYKGEEWSELRSQLAFRHDGQRSRIQTGEVVKTATRVDTGRTRDPRIRNEKQKKQQENCVFRKTATNSRLVVLAVGRVGGDDLAGTGRAGTRPSSGGGPSCSSGPP